MFHIWGNLSPNILSLAQRRTGAHWMASLPLYNSYRIHQNFDTQLHCRFWQPIPARSAAILCHSVGGESIRTCTNWEVPAAHFWTSARSSIAFNASEHLKTIQRQEQSQRPAQDRWFLHLPAKKRTEPLAKLRKARFCVYYYSVKELWFFSNSTFREVGALQRKWKGRGKRCSNRPEAALSFPVPCSFPPLTAKQGWSLRLEVQWRGRILAARYRLQKTSQNAWILIPGSGPISMQTK